MKSVKKLINYLEDYTRSQYFVDRVKIIRNELGIPKNGYPLPNGYGVHKDDTNPSTVLYLEHEGQRYITPKYEKISAYRELLRMSMTKNSKSSKKSNVNWKSQWKNIPMLMKTSL